MENVGQLLKGKKTDIWSIGPDKMVYDALKQMAEKDVGALLVTEHGQLVGVFSERDYARKVILHGLSSKETTVGELMTREVFYVEPQHTIQDCMAVMTEKRVRHVPVMNDGQLLGIITIGDVVKQVISNHEFTIQELVRYITSSWTPDAPVV